MSDQDETFEPDEPPAPAGCRTVLATEGRLYNAWAKETFIPGGRQVFLAVDDNEQQLDSDRFKKNKPVVWNILFAEPPTESDRQVIESFREVANRPDAIVAEEPPEPPPGALVFKRKRK
jgi:hypothetical protein